MRLCSRCVSWRFLWSRCSRPRCLIQRAAALVSYFQAEDPQALADAWQDALGWGPGWRKRATEGVKALERMAPELAGVLG